MTYVVVATFVVFNSEGLSALESFAIEFSATKKRFIEYIKLREFFSIHRFIIFNEDKFTCFGFRCSWRRINIVDTFYVSIISS